MLIERERVRDGPGAVRVIAGQHRDVANAVRSEQLAASLVAVSRNGSATAIAPSRTRSTATNTTVLSVAPDRRRI